MAVKGGLFILILTALVVHSSSPIARGHEPIGYHPAQALMHFNNPVDTGLLQLYKLYTPPSPKKLRRVQMLLRTRTLVLIILLFGCVEPHPVEFYNCNIFDYQLPHLKFGPNEILKRFEIQSQS